LNKNSGFTTFEIMIAVVILVILAAACVRPITGLIERIKLQNAAEGLKHFILNARVRAVSNSEQHCGIVLRIHAGANVDDTAFAFFDKNPPDNNYVAGKDALYLKPYVISKRKKMTTAIPAGYPTVFIFRGDGSSNQSAKIALTMGKYKDTVDVLASTGRVKVIVK
jgi:Tfp pilus assembly protein FimT